MINTGAISDATCFFRCCSSFLFLFLFFLFLLSLSLSLSNSSKVQSAILICYYLRLIYLFMYVCLRVRALAFDPAISSLIVNEKISRAEKLALIMDFITDLSGGKHVGFNAPVFISEQR